MHRFEAGDAWQFAAAISPDGKLAAGGEADGMVRLWDVAGQKLRLAVAAWPPATAGGSPEWIALTPEGYFDGSAKWASALRLQPVKSAVALPGSSVQSLRRPAEVLKAWHDADLQVASIAVTGAVPIAPSASGTQKSPAAGR
jgi:hypothetical protein